MAVDGFTFDHRTGRLSAVVSAPAGAPDAERQRITARVIYRTELPVLNHPLAPGDVITAEDLSQIKMRRDRIGPDVVAGFGGYVSVPVYLAARRRRLPLVVHEGNAVPGIANKLGARLIEHVATSFPNTPLPHATYVGRPSRRGLSWVDRPRKRGEARGTGALDPERPTLLVTGGSQGARRLNQAVSGAQRALADAGVQVLHVVGPAGEATVDRRPGDPPYVVVPYVDRMDLAYAAADVVVCRAGANPVTELSAVGLPAVFVPLPHGNGEQELNARPVVEAGGGLLVRDAAMTPEWVAATVPDLLADENRLATMSAAAAHLIPRDADERLAEMVLKAAR
jgi:UDP-N-acetylglucosamine--N-acetylmuramyl-(pentapeptide) pyrophosphoryl-undecaprenol N-acetylglucosamine transferase